MGASRLNQYMLTWLLMLMSSAVLAAVYKHTDAEGRVYYSDTPPSQQAQPLQLPELTPVPAYSPAKPAEPLSEASDSAPEPTPEYQLSIVSPKADQGVRANAGTVSVQLAVSPELPPTHSIRVHLDGALVYSGRALSMPIEQVARGTHTLSAHIWAEEQLLSSSDSVTFHVLRFVPKRAP